MSEVQTKEQLRQVYEYLKSRVHPTAEQALLEPEYRRGEFGATTFAEGQEPPQLFLPETDKSEKGTNSPLGFFWL